MLEGKDWQALSSCKKRGNVGVNRFDKVLTSVGKRNTSLVFLVNLVLLGAEALRLMTRSTKGPVPGLPSEETDALDDGLSK